ncbi:MAG: Gfo/Idh/MocA family oxidoreductase, partial [Thermoleophilia bacterium]|nr:Gfo/Idh/MocA family oxidoreductase [Thermoleophilia bacterium]
MEGPTVNRRQFLRATAATAAFATGKVLGANDRITVGVIGVGGRGFYLSRYYSRIGEETGMCQLVAVCDVYRRRLLRAQQQFHCDGYMDYRELIARNDIDAVVIATPDHWHAKMAIEAMQSGKDVYLEKPMCHTIEEARQLVET